MRKYSIIQAIETLYSNVKSADLFNSSTGDCLGTTVRAPDKDAFSPKLSLISS